MCGRRDDSGDGLGLLLLSQHVWRLPWQDGYGEMVLIPYFFARLTMLLWMDTFNLTYAIISMQRHMQHIGCLVAPVARVSVGLTIDVTYMYWK
jgi:hypothetical protein